MMLTRRSLLSQLVAVAGGSALAPSLSVAASLESAPSHNAALAEQGVHSGADRGALPWKNWSGSQLCYPQARQAPATVDALQQLVRETQGRIRPVGSGHSFSALVPTDDTLVSVSRLSGVIDHDAKHHQATLWAGTRLGDIGAPLAEAGQAMLNMPDIDEQTLAGALGTATHGTGAGIGCLPAFVEGMQMVLANGEVVECDRNQNADLFNAARVNLGALGIVTQVRMQNAPLYRLKREMEWLPIDDILQQADRLADSHRNFEFYYIPFSGYGFVDVQNITDEPVSTTARLDQNDGAQTLKQLRDWLSWTPKVRQLILSSYAKTMDKEVVVANSWQNYASERNVRFNEMEYHLPRENMVNAFREIRQLVETKFPEVFFPFEVRYIKSDDIWLSPFYARETCSIAVHRFYQEDYRPLFDAVEPIFRKYHGRPHWGKLNGLNAQDLKQHYANWDAFNDIRQQVDPKGKFLNRYLETLFVAA